MEDKIIQDNLNKKELEKINQEQRVLDDKIEGIEKAINGNFDYSELEITEEQLKETYNITLTESKSVLSDLIIRKNELITLISDFKIELKEFEVEEKELVTEEPVIIEE